MRASSLTLTGALRCCSDVRAALEQSRPARRQRPRARARRCGPRRAAAAAGDWHGACAAWEQILLEHPRDLYALQWAHLFDFYRGDARNLRDQRRARDAARVADRRRAAPYLLGMHAFGLEECGLYAQAEGVGREALAGDAKVPWATRRRPRDGDAGPPRRRPGLAAPQQPGWAEGNGFAGHLWWHLALFTWEAMDLEGALALHDRPPGQRHAC